MNKKPNILLITTDTQRWDTLRCMGNPHAISPNLDKLASEGVLFTQAHTSSPVCMPARTSLMTGLHTLSHGCIENGIDRKYDVPVFTDFLKDEGYINIMVGKTHFGDMPDSFDIVHQLVGEKGNESVDFYSKHVGAMGFDRASEYPNPISGEDFFDAHTIDKTIECIQEAKAQDNDRPFFAFCSLLSPHAPIDPPGEWAHIYDDVPLPEINYEPGDIEALPAHLKRLIGIDEEALIQPEDEHEAKAPLKHLGQLENGILDDSMKARIDKHRRLYYGLAAYCDHQVGRIMDYLDKSGLRENTLVIFTSDHGQQYYDHGINDKHNYYDSSWRIPFIMSMPETLPSGVTRNFAIWNDIPTTILGAAGTVCHSMQGFDLFGPLKKNEASPRKCAVGSLFTSAAVATEEWKFEYYFDNQTGRLFNRISDPEEREDLYDSNEHSVVRDRIQSALIEWRSQLNDVNHLRSNLHQSNGPVARRVKRMVNSMSGKEAEVRLNERLAEL